MSNKKRTVKASYFGHLFSKGHFLKVLLFISLIATAVVVNSDFQIFWGLSQKPDIFNAFLVGLGVIGLMGLLYLILSVRSKKFTIADCLYFALIITSPFVLLYSYLLYGDFTLKRIIVSAVMFVLGFVLMFVSSVFYSPNEVCDEKDDLALSYFPAVFRSQSFFSIIALTLLFSSMGILALNNYFSSYLWVFVRENYLIYALIACAALALIYIVMAIFSKRAGFVDSILMGAFFAMPILLLYVIFVNKSYLHLFAWAVVMGLILILYILRITFFTFAKNKRIKFKRCYFAKLFPKYNFFLAFAIALFTAIVIYTGASNNWFMEFLPTVESPFRSFLYMPLIIVYAGTFITVLCSVILALVNVCCKRVSFGDLALFICAFWSVIAILYLVLINSIIGIAISAVVLTFFITLIIIRASVTAGKTAA